MSDLMKEILKYYINDSEIKLNSKNILKKFLETDDINITNDFGCTPLMITCEENLVNLANLLIGKGADIDKKNNFKETALMKAASYGRIEIVKLLLSKDANLLLKNSCGVNAYGFARQYNRIEIIKLIEEHIEKEKEEMKEIAIRIEKDIYPEYYKETIRNFINTMNVNCANDFETSILMIAVDLSEYRFVKLLLKNGANPNHYNLNGSSPLINAIYKEDIKMIKLLMKYDTNPNYQEYKFQTPLEYSKEINNKDIIEILTNKEIKAEEKDILKNMLIKKFNDVNKKL